MLTAPSLLHKCMHTHAGPVIHSNYFASKAVGKKSKSPKLFAFPVKTAAVEERHHSHVPLKTYQQLKKS